MTPLHFGLACLALALPAACAEDYELDRRGGFTPPAVKDPPDGSAGATSAEAIAFCDALTVVRAKCQRCHGDPVQNGAPVAFLTQADFQKPYASEVKWWEVAVDVVSRDVMPYVVLNNPPTSLMPPVEPLTAAEKDTLLGWLRQGALPEGGTDCP